ncbi:hypothetical protein HMPREF0308_1870 [Corynebacterium striatum ATCC 6940]|nr:hypothetical protein HMPREF0308_1870 [Corynebacterium striatum ATCC 6940]
MQAHKGAFLCALIAQFVRKGLLGRLTYRFARGLRGWHQRPG